MSSKEVLQVNNVSKKYQIYNNPADRLFQFFTHKKKYYRDFQSLKDISFSLLQGESIGIIGRNGSGKSTLLQIIASTVTPSTGEVIKEGRIAAILELGAGFNPEYTGRENIYINAAFLGLTKEEVDARYESMVDFSEIRDFIDQPVKTYSSGMYVRLAFSVAIHVNPDILIVDEALSVGDAPFQHKCLKKIDEMKKNGMSILFVSHDLGAVKRFCEKALWIHQGELVAKGDSNHIVDMYNIFLKKKMGEDDIGKDTLSSATEIDKSTAEILDVKFVNLKDAFIKTGDNLEIEVHYKVKDNKSDKITIGIAIFRNDHLEISSINTKLDNFLIDGKTGENTVRVTFPAFSLLPGEYYFKVGVFDYTTNVPWDFLDHSLPISVVNDYLAEGLVSLNHEWRLIN